MKKIILICSFIYLSQYCLSQSFQITPDISTEQCPGTTITFTVSIQAKSIQNVQAKALNVNPIVVNNVYDISSSSGIYTFKFDGSFVDVNDNQTFTVNYTDINGVNSFHDFTFTKIKSLNIPSPLYSQVKPNPASITAPRCQSQNFNIYFNNVQFSNSALSNPIAYGTITDYEYLLPKGWMLNGQTATGTNWLPGKNNVSVTSDLSNGDNTYIQIRAVNPCGANLIKGHNSDIGLIKVSRPAPTLSITGNSFNLCNATTGAYTINGMPPGATVL